VHPAVFVVIAAETWVPLHLFHLIARSGHDILLFPPRTRFPRVIGNRSALKRESPAEYYIPSGVFAFFEIQRCICCLFMSI
jgi:hypothetical protein